jgi:hypothetical protein
MKRLWVVFALVVPVLLLVAATVGQEAEKGKGRRVVRRTVAVPQDTTPFKIESNCVVRLTGEGIAGSKIVAGVEGPARVVAENAVIAIAKGRVLTGPGNREFEIGPTGQGHVKVTITVTPPQPDAQPRVTSHEFEVQ